MNILDPSLPKITDFTLTDWRIYLGQNTTNPDRYILMDELIAYIVSIADSKYIYLPFAMSQINTDVAGSTDIVFDLTVYENCRIDNNSFYVAAGVAPTGSTMVINFYDNSDTSLFTTAISIDSGEKTSLTAATPYALTSSTIDFSKGDRIYGKITQAGATVAGQNVTGYIKALKL